MAAQPLPKKQDDAKVIMAAAGKTVVHGTDPIGQLMNRYDTDGNGTFDVGEVRQIINDVQAAKAQTKVLQKITAGLLGAIILLAGVMFVTSFVAGDMLKESHNIGGAMTGLDGNVVQTDGVSSDTTLWDVPLVEAAILAKMKSVTLYIDMTAAPIASIVDAAFSMCGAWKKDTNKAFLKTCTGALITIDRVAQTGTINIDGTTYPVLAEEPVSASRRMDTADGEKPEFYPEARRVLRRGGRMVFRSYFTIGRPANRAGSD